jgi:hypothetical protein
MRHRQAFVDVEAKIIRLFFGLTLPETGISKGWLDNIKTLRGLIADSNTYYGFAVTSLVAGLVDRLHGSAAGTWAISKQLEELLDTIQEVESDLLAVNDGIVDLDPDLGRPFITCVN